MHTNISVAGQASKTETVPFATRCGTRILLCFCLLQKSCLELVLKENMLLMKENLHQMGKGYGHVVGRVLFPYHLLPGRHDSLRNVLKNPSWLHGNSRKIVSHKKNSAASTCGLGWMVQANDSLKYQLTKKCFSSSSLKNCVLASFRTSGLCFHIIGSQ